MHGKDFDNLLLLICPRFKELETRKPDEYKKYIETIEAACRIMDAHWQPPKEENEEHW